MTQTAKVKVCKHCNMAILPDDSPHASQAKSTRRVCWESGVHHMYQNKKGELQYNLEANTEIRNKDLEHENKVLLEKLCVLTEAAECVDHPLIEEALTEIKEMPSWDSFKGIQSKKDI